MISYGKQTIDQSDIDAVVDSLNSDWLTQGPRVKNFENDLSEHFGALYTCAVSNGTAALHLVAKILNWKPDDIIITTPITFLATANCIEYVGASVDFVDIDLDTYTINTKLLDEKISLHLKNGRKVKAVIAVDYAGHPCDWKSLSEISSKYNIKLINDNCHAMGASYYRDSKYAAKYADVVTQSFHPVKHITTGEGGAIITNDEAIISKAYILRSHGMERVLKLNDDSEVPPWYYEMNEVGYNYRITDFQCALGSNQLLRINEFLKKRRIIADRYNSFFSKLDHFHIPKYDESFEHAFHLYPLCINYDALQKTKLDFFKYLQSKNIFLQVHYIPIHLQPYYSKKYNFKIGDFPVSEKFYKSELSLPIYPELSLQDQDYVISKIINFFN